MAISIALTVQSASFAESVFQSEELAGYELDMYESDDGSEYSEYVEEDLSLGTVTESEEHRVQVDNESGLTTEALTLNDEGKCYVWQCIEIFIYLSIL